MRDMNAITISKACATATIGGATLARDLTKALDSRNYITPTWAIQQFGLYNHRRLTSPGDLSRFGNIFSILFCWSGDDLNEKLAGARGYGRAWTVNLRNLSSKTAAILAKHSTLIPGPGMLFSAQMTRAGDDQLRSALQPRETHYWLEIVGFSLDPEVAQKAEEWDLISRMICLTTTETMC
ncbi:hypothetical protein F66182_7771 [Fusarium sp. NRRL 66182]|nr:hypothetical protein F66182_7771 [Fusarium sp. NRRL 66182]